MEEAFNQLKKEFNSLRVSFTECRTEFALSKCKSDDKISELQGQVAALAESNAELFRRVNELSPQPVVAPWEKSDSKSGIKSEHMEPTSSGSKNDKVEEAVKDKSPLKPRAKDWDAFCRLLSEVEEKEALVPEEAPISPAPKQSILEKIQQSRPNIPQENWDVIEFFMSLFRAYMDSLRSWSIQPLMQHILDEVGPAIRTIVAIVDNWEKDSPEFVPLAQALLLKIPRMCEEMELNCRKCSFRIFTPVNMLDHLVSPLHVQAIKEVDALYEFPATAVQRVLARLSALLKRPHLGKTEIELQFKGEELFRKLKDDPRLRPTEEFATMKSHEYLNLACEGDQKAIELAYRDGVLKPEDDEYRMRVIRKWIKKNRQKIVMELDEHLRTGVAYCSSCKVAYVSKADFYKHLTGYLHSSTDMSIYGGYMIRIASCDEDWNAFSS